MNHEKFDNLVARLERRFARRPAALKLRLIGWVALGYAAFLFWLVLLLVAGLAAFFAGAFSNTGEGILFVIIGGVLVALGAIQTLVLVGVRLEPPKGYSLSPAEAPRLFAIVDEFQAATRCTVHQVLVTAELNASVTEIPRLGVFGWPRRFLRLGLPLLEMISPDEFRSVVAHEFAHLSGEHGRFSNWIYRLRISWQGVFQHLHTNRRTGLMATLAWLLNRFIDWYWPRFNARAFVLCRAHEYVADAWAAEHAEGSALAQSLWRMECYNRRLKDEFWPALRQLANSQAQPPDDIVERQRQTLAQPALPTDESRWVDQSCRSLTDHADTHPCFAARAEALGQPIDGFRRQGYPRAPDVSAATVLFAESRGKLAVAVSQEWQQEVALDWSGRNVRAGALARRLEMIEQSASAVNREESVLWDRARVMLDMAGPAAAEDLLRQLLSIQPAHSGANLALGQWWLEQGKSEGEALLERVLDDEDSEWTAHAGEALAEHFRNTGAQERLKAVRGRLDRYAAALADSRHERSVVTAGDRFVAHELSSAELQALQLQLGEAPDLFAAWLVRKELRHFRRRRLFVLCVRTRPNWFGFSPAERDTALVNRLIPQVQLPGQFLIIAPQGGFKSLARKVMTIGGSKVFSANLSSP